MINLSVTNNELEALTHALIEERDRITRSPTVTRYGHLNLSQIQELITRLNNILQAEK